MTTPQWTDISSLGLKSLLGLLENKAVTEEIAENKEENSVEPLAWRIYAWGISDVGMKREHNEDSYLLLPEYNAFVVADGMGGHAGGEMASGVSVRTILDFVTDHKETIAPGATHDGPVDQSPVARLASDAVREACRAVYQKSQEIKELENMGTTTVFSVYHQQYLFIGHVGDSRAYLIRDGHIAQLTDDHSLVNEQLKAGLITEQQAQTSRFKNIITRSVGFEEDVDVDVIVVETRPGDAVLLCSDGLSGLVTDKEINDIVNENFLRRAPELLVNLANERGGDDNITIVLTYISDGTEPAWDHASDDPPEAVIGGAAFNAGM